MLEQIQDFARALKSSRYAVALTGAGASTESGLPDFRSNTGLWKDVDPVSLISMTALRRRPVDFYRFYRMRFSHLWGAQPNPVHKVLAALQREGLLKRLITQNVDGLHQAAGSPDVIELHGSLRECQCLRCGRRFPSRLIDVEVETEADIPRCPECGGVLKPGVVLFEEALPADAIEAAIEAAMKADLFLVVGSSLEVGPANQLPVLAVQHGGRLAIFNLTPTFLDPRATWIFREKAGQALGALAAELGISL
ncbi:MAG: hypothetical protein A6D92_05605 [Symbiobacterium thermophilum]|uniref:NAD-dependent protein deacetylase n=1 Tax=Symbiobacterium thermophilum TaxID=2734 RepID=A0A1Y2T528_SYMTR|nr:MAG: hypothetical protein A6D92_05605 [Symbiobacterium thermophilum]